MKRISKANIFEAAISRDEAHATLVDQLLNLFGGRPISIPGVPWFQPEFSVQGPNYLIGLHIDVGAFLGGRGGFGRAGDGPQPLTPPGPE